MFCKYILVQQKQTGKYDDFKQQFQLGLVIGPSGMRVFCTHPSVQ